MNQLDARISELSEKYLPLAVEMLKEVIRIPADYVDKPLDQGGDPECGLSNHEGPRLEYLRDKIIEIGGVRSADDIGFDEYGNLVWTVSDPDDGIPDSEKRVVYFDGHTDTVRALRDQWLSKTNRSVDSYDGVIDSGKMAREFLRSELGYLPEDSEWDNMVFGQAVLTSSAESFPRRLPPKLHWSLLLRVLLKAPLFEPMRPQLRKTTMEPDRCLSCRRCCREQNLN